MWIKCATLTKLIKNTNSNSSNWLVGFKQIKSIPENPPERKAGLLNPKSGRQNQSIRESQIAFCC